MIDQNKVRLMTKIQCFEDRETSAKKANTFFQWDYLTMYILRSFFAYCVLFMMVIAVFCIYNWEALLAKLDMNLIIQGGKALLLGFVLLLIPTMIVSYIVYWFRYRKEMKKIRAYQDNLRELRRNYYQEKISKSED